MAILISILALMATFYQLYLQRVHNEKSLKPLGQIVLEDRQESIAVHVCNNGLGPLIIDQLTFIKDGQPYPRIDNCLTLDLRSYMHISTDDSVRRIVLPNASLTIFEDRLRGCESQAELAYIRHQLAPITLQVEGRDIYDNKIRLDRGFQWFSRRMPEPHQIVRMSQSNAVELNPIPTQVEKSVDF